MTPLLRFAIADGHKGGGVLRSRLGCAIAIGTPTFVFRRDLTSIYCAAIDSQIRNPYRRVRLIVVPSIATTRIANSDRLARCIEIKPIGQPRKTAGDCNGPRRIAGPDCLAIRICLIRLAARVWHGVDKRNRTTRRKRRD